MPIRRRRYKRNARRYVPSIYRRRSAFTSNYIRCKIDVVDTIGPFIYGSGTGLSYAFAHGDGTNASSIYTISDMLVGNAQFAKLATVFALCKIKGISVEMIPTGEGTLLSWPVTMAYFNSDSLGIGFAQINENPNMMMLDPTKRKYKYISLYGDTGDWKPVSGGSFDGRFIIDQQMPVATNPVNAKFNIKFSIFMIFKQAEA